MNKKPQSELNENILAVHHSAGHLDYVWRTPKVELYDQVRLESDLLSQTTEIMKTLGAAKTSIPERVAGLGTRLAQQLLPSAIAQALAKLMTASETSVPATQQARLAPALRIISNEGSVPWELMRPADADAVLGERVRLTRWLFDIPCPRSFGLSPFVLCVAGPKETEKHFAQEVRLVRTAIEELGGDYSTVEPQTADILDRLKAESPAALHVVAHAGRNDKSPLLTHIRLQGNERLTVSDLAVLDFHSATPRPFVFFNACESAAPSLGFQGAEGFATQLVEQGAAALIGTYWKVDDHEASKVSEHVYEALGKERLSLGEALRTARQTLWTSSSDPSPLGYTAYGHPEAQVNSELKLAPAVRWPGRFLEIPRKEYEPDLSAPGALLRADHGIVPFHLRHQELDSLKEWATSQDELGIRLYTGPGGQGKTRLALQLCHELRREGWRAGFVKSSADESIEEALEEIFHRGGPVLAVVDYAETRRSLLAPIAELIHRKRQDGPFRLILLARRREEWWEQLKREAEPIGSVFAGPATRHLALQPLATGIDQRKETFELAARSFADELGKDKPEMPELDLEARYFDPVLMLHMYALIRVENTPVKGEDGILDNTLHREERFWEKQLKFRELPLRLLQGVRRLMCTITLAGGSESFENTLAWMSGLKYFQGQSRDVLEDVANLLHTLYPGERWIAPILPDILGEHLIERELAHDPQEVFNLVLGPQTESP